MSTDYLRKLALFVQHTTSTYPCNGLAPVPHIGSRTQPVGSVVVIGSRAEGRVPTGPDPALVSCLGLTQSSRVCAAQAQNGIERRPPPTRGGGSWRTLVMVGRLSGLLFSYE